MPRFGWLQWRQLSPPPSHPAAAWPGGSPVGMDKAWALSLGSVLLIIISIVHFLGGGEEGSRDTYLPLTPSAGLLE